MSNQCSSCDMIIYENNFSKKHTFPIANVTLCGWLAVSDLLESSSPHSSLRQGVIALYSVVEGVKSCSGE